MIFLKKEVIVKKKRKLYLYNNTRVHLDEVENLGKFLELETLLITNKKDATKRFNEIKSLLGLSGFEEIKKSYKILLSEK